MELKPLFQTTQSQYFSPRTSQKSLDSSYGALSSSKSNSKLFNTEIVSAAVQLKPKFFDPQTDTQLSQSLWETEIKLAEIEQQNKTLLKE